MRLGVAIEETWAFFTEIFAEFSEHHQTTLFERRTVNLPIFEERINRALFNRDLRSLLKNNQVVFFEWASELLQVACSQPKTCGIVTRLHRYEMYRWSHRIHWDAVDKIILVSHAKEREFLRRYPAQAGKTLVVPESISMERFQPHAKPYQGDIGILCHLTPRKRVYELILAFNELLRENENFRLHIGGGMRSDLIDYYDALLMLVENLGLQDKVVFYGKVEDPEMWYHNIDIFISNSYSEGLQVSPMEAIASGCYCLSHHWDGADELLPPANLFITEREFVQRILEYHNATEETRQLKLAGLQKMVRERFNTDQIKVRIREIVEEVGVQYIPGG